MKFRFVAEKWLKLNIKPDVDEAVIESLTTILKSVYNGGYRDGERTQHDFPRGEGS